MSHCSIRGQSSSDYRYLGLYPTGAPRYDNNFCKASEEETKEKARAAKGVPIPASDPIFGADGPLIKIWQNAANEAGSNF